MSFNKNMQAKKYDQVHFKDECFARCDLRRARFSSCTFEDCDFSSVIATLTTWSDCKFHNCTAENALFDCSNFTRVDFGNTRFDEATFSGSSIDKCKLSASRWCNVIGNNKQIRTLQMGAYCVTLTADTMSIGCQQKTWDFMRDVTQTQLEALGGADGAAWYRTWNNIIWNMRPAI